MPDENGVLDAFHAVRAALLSNDVEKMKTLIALDYRGFNLAGGVDTRDLVLEAYRPGSVKLDKAEVGDLVVDVIGDVGFVSGTSRLSGRFGEHVFGHYFRFLDVFVRREGEWIYYLSQGTEIQG